MLCDINNPDRYKFVQLMGMRYGYRLTLRLMRRLLTENSKNGHAKHLDDQGDSRHDSPIRSVLPYLEEPTAESRQELAPAQPVVCLVCPRLLTQSHLFWLPRWKPFHCLRDRT